MNNYLQTNTWQIVEEGLHADKQLASERIFSLGNGNIIQRANFEEYNSGDTLAGAHIAGLISTEIIENDTWKNKNSELQEPIINAPNWTSIIIRLNEEVLDLATWDVLNFRRVLNMREGILERTFEAVSPKGHHMEVSVKRFLSMAETEIGAITYSIKSLNFVGRISIMPIIDAEVTPRNLSDKDQLWNVLQTKTQQDVAHLWTQTRRTDFHICTAMTYVLYKNKEQINIIPIKIEKEKVAGFSIGTDVKIGDTLTLHKYVAIINSMNHPRKELTERACKLALDAKQKGWNKLLEEHTAILAEKWLQLDADTEMEAHQDHQYATFRTLQGLNNKEEVLTNS